MKTLTTTASAVAAFASFFLPCAVSLGITGCGGSSSSSPSAGGANPETTTFPSSPLSAVMTDAGKLHVELHSAPYQPLVAGVDSIELVITDAATGDAANGLTITMTPWMPAMGHGASVTPLLTPLGEGRYVFTNVSLFMPGEWQLRLSFSGEVEDSVEPTFTVE